MAERESMNHPPGLPETNVSGQEWSLAGCGNAGPVERLDSYLKLVEECMDGVQRMPSRKFNKKQCQYLAYKLKEVVQNARLFLEVSLSDFHGSCLYEDTARHVEIFKVLLALAKQIESFIQGCCKEAWIQAATILLTNDSEYVSSIGFNLELLRIVFTNEHATAAMLTMDQVDEINKAEVEIVDKKSHADLLTLLGNVTLELNSSSGENRDLANYLLQRLLKRQLNPASFTSGASSWSDNDDRGFFEDLFKRVQPTERLGRGTSAVVHKAMWLGTPVARKIFHGQANPEFMKEVEILTKLSHPNIASMFCYAKDKRQWSIVMDLMDEDLHTLISRRCEENIGSPPFTILESVDIMLQLGEGLNYLHNKRIVHRDLKSMNILVRSVKMEEAMTGYVHVKVADFGLSKIKESSVRYSNQTFNVGTSRWRAPEIINLNFVGSQVNTAESEVPKYPFKCDIFSFAMVCSEILTGNVPFSNVAFSKKVKRMVVKGARPDLPNHCPPMLKALIEKCWNKVPMERPSTAIICSELKYLKYLLMKGFIQDHALTTEKPVQVVISKDQQQAAIKDMPLQTSTRDMIEEPLQVATEDVPLQTSTEDMVTFPNPLSKPPIHLPSGIQLGKGSTAVVNEVVYQGCKFAKKTFFTSAICGFEKEVSLLKGLSHPNVMSLRYWGECKSKCFIVMDLMDADLDQYMNEIGDSPPFTIREAVDIMLQIARGVNYLHQKNIVHRDLKSANILLKRVKKIESKIEHLLARVSDFGLAIVKDKSRTTSELDPNTGTNRWMAPEIIRFTNMLWPAKIYMSSSMKLPFKCDVYSFAMVCYEILTGNEPFLSIRNPNEVKRMVLNNERPELPALCPPELVALIKKCWDMNPSRRPKFDDICEKLERLKASLGTGIVDQDTQMVNSAFSSAGKGTESIHTRNYSALDPEDKVGCNIPCTWMVSAAIFLALAILLALVMSREDRLYPI